MLKRCLALGLFAISVVGPAIGRADEEVPVSSTSTSKADRDQLERSVLGGQDAGSISNPLKLGDVRVASRVCRAMQDPKSASIPGDVYRRSHVRKQRRQERMRALASAYSVTLPARSFEISEYVFAEQHLPLELSRALTTFDGALILQVMDRRGAFFDLAPEVAKGIAAKLEKDKVSLRIAFRPADDEHPACFAYPKSDAFNLRIRPLSYELVEDGTATVLARAETPAFVRLQRWLEPGEARLTIKFAGLAGHKSEKAIEASVNAARSAFERCTKSIIASSTETLFASLGAEVMASGSVLDVRVDAHDAKHDDAVDCLKRSLASVTLPRGTASARFQVLVAVERGESDTE